jgi:uncharacterized damage-inducible protein DinB
MAASEKQQYTNALKDELGRTKRFLAAFPPSASELKPHETSQSAREVVHTLCAEAMISIKVLDGSLDLAKLSFPKPPATWDEVTKAFHDQYDALLATLEKTPDGDFAQTIPFMTGPKQIGPMPKGDIVRFMLSDHVHHRGQLSVYLRMSGSKVPSIYGPSKDEPWN